MRTIKFRGKRVDNGELVYGSLIYRKNSKDSLVGECSCFIVLEDDKVALRSLKTMENSYEFRCVQVIPETVGQFTGLTDKNGKEIYEGDIVSKQDQNDDFSGNVIFENGGFIVDVGYRWIPRWNEIEVIGNIHDNPELLK